MQPLLYWVSEEMGPGRRCELLPFIAFAGDSGQLLQMSKRGLRRKKGSKKSKDAAMAPGTAPEAAVPPADTAAL